MKEGYRLLGDFIRQVDVRNTDGKEENLLGVSVQKMFIPSIANTVGTDFTKYKVVKRGQFTYIPDTSRRGDKIGIALLTDYDEGLVSNIYTVFEVKDENELLPEYLMLWFSRPEFDRYARFKSHGSVREIMDWDEMCKVKLPVPSIEKQRSIVKAKQLGDPIYSERRTQNIEFLGKISNDSKNGYGINRSNKQEVVSQYIPSFNPMYDEVVNRDRNAGSIILASNNYFITAIEEYKVDDLRYDFNGVIISRFKVLRIYETLIKNRMAGTYNAILYAICKNSILTEEQYRNITACLDRTFGNLKGVARG